MNIQRIFRNTKSPSEVLKVALSIGVSVGLILFAAAVILDTLNSFSSAYQKAMIVKNEQTKVDNMRLENLQKQQLLSYVLSDKYVENIARSEFNYLKHGEVIFVLPDTSGASYKTSSDGNASAPTTSPMQDWVKLLFE